jgi:hypothetical protein
MKINKLHFIDYVSIGLLVSLLFFTVFSSNYLAEKRVTNTRAEGEEGGFDYTPIDNATIESGGVPVPEQTVTNEAFVPSGGTSQIGTTTEGVVGTNERLDGNGEEANAANAAGVAGGAAGSAAGGAAGSAAGGAAGSAAGGAASSRNPADTTYYKDANGNWVKTSTTGAGEAAAGNTGAPAARNPASGTPASGANSLGNQLVNSLAQSLLKNITNPASSSQNRPTTGTTSTGTTSTGTTSTGTTSTGTTATNSTSGTSLSNTAAPAESLNAPNGVPVSFNLKLAFQGVVKKPVDSLNKMKVKVTLVDPQANTSKRTAIAFADFTADAAGVWSGTVNFTKVEFGEGYYLLVKGPKHLQKRICSLANTVVDTTGSGCSGTFAISQANIPIDFSKNALATGDLPVQDASANTRDLGSIKLGFGKTDYNSLNSYDLNLDGAINSLDYSLIIQTMLRNGDDQT